MIYGVPLWIFKISTIFSPSSSFLGSFGGGWGWGIPFFFFNNSIHYLFYICLGYSSLGYTLSSYVFGAPYSECGLHSPLGRSDDAAAQTADSSTVPQIVTGSDLLVSSNEGSELQGLLLVWTLSGSMVGWWSWGKPWQEVQVYFCQNCGCACCYRPNPFF